ncbi:MAG: threonine ammonia-lyase [Methanolinea sp.]|nr:threonine ammonia-lyase [Methanolinea sp.]
MVTLADIRAAASLLEGKVIDTPLVHSPTFSSATGAEVYLKLECMQKAGSFKVRGATCRIISRRTDIGEGGVVAASAGNHAQGVAVAASLAGVPATIVMPRWVSLSKQEATTGYGARVILRGESLEESIEIAKKIAVDEGMTFIHPYDDDLVIAGQGTIGLEILRDLPDVQHVVVPVGGGGLISGIAIALRGLKPGISITGVQSEACPSAVEALAAGFPVIVDAAPTVADGIRVKRIGDITFPIVRDLVDQVVLVDEEAIVNAILQLLERKKVLAEGAGAAPLAGILQGKVRMAPGEKVVVVISGGNVDTFLLERILKKGLYTSGRILQAQVILEEEGRSLPGLLDIVTSKGGVISQIIQERSVPGLPVHQMRVTLELEVRGHPHREELIAAMREAGYRFYPSPADGRGQPGENPRGL